MADLFFKITQDLTLALKQKDEAKVSTLRLLIASLENARIAKGSELIDEEILAEIATDAKRHKESIEAFRQGERADLVAKEEKELAILQEYLPQQMTEGDIAKIVDEVIIAIGASGLSDMGKVMAQVMPKFKGKADGAQVSRIVKEKLG